MQGLRLSILIFQFLLLPFSLKAFDQRVDPEVFTKEVPPLPFLSPFSTHYNQKIFTQLRYLRDTLCARSGRPSPDDYKDADYAFVQGQIRTNLH